MVTVEVATNARPNSRYAAFISYNRGVDGELSSALQDALQSLARPWYRRRALRVFRDVTVLAASPDAWAAVEKGLDESEFLIVLASPQAAASEWVNKEVVHWLATKPRENVLLALTAGELVWDKASGDFDWAQTTALPTALRGRFTAEPSWVDLRATRDFPRKSRSRVWRAAVAPIAAALHHTTVDQILRNDERVFRRNRLTAAVAAVCLVALAVTSTFFAVRANRQTQVANQQLRVAVSGQLAARSELLGESDPVLSDMLAAAAWRIDESQQSAHAVVAALTRRVRNVLTGHTSSVLDVAFSPDGQIFATGGGDGTARLWNAATGQPLVTLASSTGGANDGVIDAVTKVVFSPDGRTLATGEYGTARIWDTATGQPFATLAGGSGRTWITELAFSHDGRVVATAADNGTARLWNAATGEPLGPLVGQSDSLTTTVALSPDGRALATAGFDGSARLWDVSTGQLIATVLPSDPSAPICVDFCGDVELADRAEALAFSPDGRVLATAGTDGAVRLWDSSTGQHLATFTGHTEGVSAVVFSHDGRTLASAAYDLTVRIWEVATGATLAALAVDGRTWAADLAFSPDGHALLTGHDDNLARLWDAATGQLLATLPGHIGRVGELAFNPDGRTFATGSDDGTVRLWDADANQPLATLIGHTYMVVAVAFSPDGQRLATASTYDEAGGGDGGPIGDIDGRLWNVATGQTVATLAGTVNAVAFSPDGQTVGTADMDSAAQLWNVATGQPLATFGDQSYDGRGLGVAISPDGRTVATNADDGTVRLWDASTRDPIATLSDATGAAPSYVYGLAYSPDGRTLATAASDNSVRLWDTATGDAIATLTGHTDDVVGVAFSPDGRTLITAGNRTVRRWDRYTGEILTTTLFATAVGRVNGVAFSPDRRTLAIAGDTTARLWDLNTGQPIATLHMAAAGRANAVAFSPDGRILATANNDNTIRLWEVPIVGDRHAALCARIGRSMTEEEWEANITYLLFEPVC